MLGTRLKINGYFLPEKIQQFYKKLTEIYPDKQLSIT